MIPPVMLIIDPKIGKDSLFYVQKTCGFLHIKKVIS